MRSTAGARNQISEVNESPLVRHPRNPPPKTAVEHTAEEWIVHYHLALLELDKSRMASRLSHARHAMFDRIEELRNVRGSHDIEHKAIHDALDNLRFLEKEHQNWLAEQQRLAR
jgi:hypothetical protein